VTYPEFRETVTQTLRQAPDGMTWKELREAASLPYTRACPEWIAALEREAGLVRRKGAGRALVWEITVQIANVGSTGDLPRR